MRRTGWWRLNRGWLTVLPVAVVLAAGASSYRVRAFWYDDGPHHQAAHAPAGSSVLVHQSFEDGAGPTSRTYRVRALGVEERPDVPGEAGGDPGPVPSGATAYTVRLRFTADPDQDLNYCKVVLVDADGRRYGGEQSDLLDQTNLCVPADTPGPRTPLAEGDRRGVVEGEPRPRTWTVAPVVLVAQGADVRKVRVEFAPPDYVTLDLPRGR